MAVFERARDREIGASVCRAGVIVMDRARTDERRGSGPHYRARTPASTPMDVSSRIEPGSGIRAQTDR